MLSIPNIEAKYKVVMDEKALNKVQAYKADLADPSQNITLGTKFKHQFTEMNKSITDEELKKIISDMSIEEFIEKLINSKEPVVFAESQITGIDWTPREQSILGDINIVAPVEIYDNGQHRTPIQHNKPFKGTLLFTPGALMKGNQPELVDFNEVTTDGKLDEQKYYELYERRLLPLLIEANNSAAEKGKKAFITIPGIGCGEFAGIFKGKLGPQLENVLAQIISNHSEKLQNIKAIYYDPFKECKDRRETINGITFMVRPSGIPSPSGVDKKSQLYPPTAYEEQYVKNGKKLKDDFSDCEFFSFVAWDHVSRPGNEAHLDLRHTDDAVKAAATNVMSVMTNEPGTYDKTLKRYRPIKGGNWMEQTKGKKLEVKGRIFVTQNGEMKKLDGNVLKQGSSIKQPPLPFNKLAVRDGKLLRVRATLGNILKYRKDLKGEVVISINSKSGKLEISSTNEKDMSKLFGDEQKCETVVVPVSNNHHRTSYVTHLELDEGLKWLTGYISSYRNELNNEVNKITGQPNQDILDHLVVIGLEESIGHQIGFDFENKPYFDKKGDLIYPLPDNITSVRKASSLENLMGILKKIQSFFINLIPSSIIKQISKIETERKEIYHITNTQEKEAEKQAQEAAVAEKAAQNLSAATKLKWVAIKEDGQFVLQFDGDIEKMKFDVAFKEQSFFRTSDQLKIEFIPDLIARNDRIYSATFSNPLEIKAMAAGQFKYPKIDASVLSDATRAVRAIVAPIHVDQQAETISSADNKLEVSFIMSGTDYSKCKEELIEHLKNGGLFCKDISSTLRGHKAEGVDKVTIIAKFDPLEMVALSTYSKQRMMTTQHITPEMAGAIYFAAGKIIEPDYLNKFSNESTPRKFALALQTLNIPVQSISFHERNGYDVNLSHGSLEKIKQYHEEFITEKRNTLHHT